MPDDISPDDLDREIRAELRSLPGPVADRVARHLAAAGQLIDDVPGEALGHAVAARRLAPRIAAVREAVGLAAYRAGEWQTAIAELRTYHRMSGRQTHLAVLADCERALGRPERALELYRAGQRAGLGQPEAIELLIVAAGATVDLGRRDAALAMLEIPELSRDEPTTWLARLRYAYAETLLEAGRRAEARDWFARAVDVDVAAETAASERLLELDGVVLADGGDGEAADAEEAGDGGDPAGAAVGRVGDEPGGARPDEVPGDTPTGETLTGTDRVGTAPAGSIPEGTGTGTGPAAAERVGHPETGAGDRDGGPAADRGAAGDDPGSDRPLVDGYDLVVLDLDGVVLLGEQAIPSAVEAVRRLRRDGLPVVFATNNASRSPGELAALLAGLGVPAGDRDVLTSASVAADVLSGRVPPGSRVLVVGAGALADEVRRVGLQPVSVADDQPAAVVQGYGPDVGWAELAEAAVAVRAGAVWVATNTDLTLPSPRGPLPGNGALVGAVAATVDRQPDLVVGKPRREFFAMAALRTGASAPLVVGDRLETDIEGAYRAGMDSLLVLTGVTDRSAALAAAPPRRPAFIGDDLLALFLPPQRLPGQATEPAPG